MHSVFAELLSNFSSFFCLRALQSFQSFLYQWKTHKIYSRWTLPLWWCPILNERQRRRTSDFHLTKMKLRPNFWMATGKLMHFISFELLRNLRKIKLTIKDRKQQNRLNHVDNLLHVLISGILLVKLCTYVWLWVVLDTLLILHRFPQTRSVVISQAQGTTWYSFTFTSQAKGNHYLLQNILEMSSLCLVNCDKNGGKNKFSLQIFWYINLLATVWYVRLSIRLETKELITINGIVCFVCFFGLLI